MAASEATRNISAPTSPLAAQKGIATFPSHSLPTRRFVLWTLLLVVLWNLCSWVYISRQTERQALAAVRLAELELRQNLDEIAEGLQRNLAVFHGIPSIIGRDPSIIQVLTQGLGKHAMLELSLAVRRDRLSAEPALAAINKNLNQGTTDVRALAVIWVMDLSGTALMASNASNAESFVGTNFADRAYFKEAIAGRNGQQFALGRRTNIPGLFFSAPIKDRGKVIGVVAAKINLPFLAYWINQANAFVVDSFDIIIMAQNKQLEMRALPKGRYATLDSAHRQGRYKRETFSELKISAWSDQRFPSLLRIDDGAQPTLMAQRPIEGEELTVGVLKEVPEVASLTDDFARNVILAALLGTMFIVVAAGGLYYVVNLQNLQRYRTHQKHIEHLATHDALTGLFNRTSMDRLIQYGIALAKRARTHLAVVYVDLDFFKDINDSLGHEIGDEVLKIVAERLSFASRASDTIIRQGGDEFIMLLNNISAPNDVAGISTKVLDLLKQPILVAENSLSISASLGIAIYPNDGDTTSILLRNADLALYRAKNRGRGDFCFYHEKFQADAVDRLSLEQDLRQALVHKQFTVHYQPQYSLQRKQFVGCEALVRWNHPHRGLVSPAEFIPVTEKNGLIIPLGQWVLEEACQQASRWHKELGYYLPVSVNISVVQFRKQDFVHKVQSALQKAFLPAHCLELELTENVIMDDCAESLEIMQALGNIGVTLAIDDFGTGYSSLSYLKRFDEPRLKIDRSFVMNMENDADDREIIRAIINLSRSLHLRVIAEGVETAAQAALLVELGCTEIQGYWFCKPVPGDECLAFLKRKSNEEITDPINA